MKLNGKEIEIFNKLSKYNREYYELDKCKVVNNILVGHHQSSRNDIGLVTKLREICEEIVTFKISTNQRVRLFKAPRVVIHKGAVLTINGHYITQRLYIGKEALDLNDGSRTTIVDHERQLIIAPNKMGSWIGKGGKVIKNINQLLNARYKVVKE